MQSSAGSPVALQEYITGSSESRGWSTYVTSNEAISPMMVKVPVSLLRLM